MRNAVRIPALLVAAGVATGTCFSIGSLTVTKTGAGKLVLTAQYLPPPQFRVNSFEGLSGRKVEIRAGADVVLSGTIP